MADPTYVPVVQNGGPLNPTTLTVSGLATFNGAVDVNGYTTMEGGQFNGDMTVFGTTTAAQVNASGLDVSGAQITVGGSDYRLPANEFGPQDHGLETWTHDPYLAASSAIAVNGTLYLVKLNVRRAVTLDTVWWVVGTAGATPVAGQNLVGLYSSAGTLLASANVDADISSSGTKSTAITAQALAANSFVWVAFLFNATTAPTLLRGSSFESSPNINLAAASRRACVNGTALTALPASITPASNSTSGSLTYFAALSE